MFHRMAIILVLLPAATAFGGGEMARTEPTEADVVTHSRQVTRALQITTEEACAAVQREATKYARMTTVVQPKQDSFGDPMYSRYGSRALAGSPMYNGPAYVSSFERGISHVFPDPAQRSYSRGAYSRSQVMYSTDTSVRSGATQSYVQQGMLMNPGSWAPSVHRAPGSNAWY